MVAWEEELGTEVSAELDLTDLDNILSLEDEHGIFDEVKNYAGNLKTAIEEGSKKGVKDIAGRNRSFQEQLLDDLSQHPYAEGKLASSINDEEKDEYTYLVGTRINHIYPMSVEYGADIYPVNAKVLRFQPNPALWHGKIDKDGFVYLKEAHPKPHPYVQPAYEKTDQIAKTLMLVYLGQELSKIQ